MFQWVCVAWLAVFGGSLQAHVVTQIFAEWKTSQTWEIQVLFDAGYAIPELRDDQMSAAPERKWLLGLGEEQWAPLRQEAERYLRECLEVKSNGHTENWKVVFTDFEKSPPDFPEVLNDGAYFRMRVIGEKSLESPAEISWRSGKRPSLVMQMPGNDATYLTLLPGETLPLPAPGKPSPEKSIGTAPWLESFKQGFLHVLPKGLDHILFIVGLFFYARRWRPLFSQSLAFTLAHTVTLGLAAAGMVKLPSHWVEPLIALSIAVIALENLGSARIRRPWMRLSIVFGFGLIHGLGFAGALSVWLKPGKGFLPSLLSANIGVELAQAAVLLSAWILTLRWHETTAYYRLRKISCIGIAATGVVWMIQRI